MTRRWEKGPQPRPKARLSWRALVVTAILLVPGALIYDALRVPQMQAPTASADRPFRVHFRLKNPSLLFTMSGIRVTCVTQDAELEQHLHLKDITSALSATVDVKPGMSLGYACPVDRVLAGLGAPRNITVSLKGSFATLGKDRQFETAQFRWGAKEPVWKEWIAAR